MLTYEQFKDYMNQYMKDLASEEPTWDKDACDWARSTGLAQGDEQGRIMAKKFLTRGEFFTVMQRFVTGQKK